MQKLIDRLYTLLEMAERSEEGIARKLLQEAEEEIEEFVQAA